MLIICEIKDIDVETSFSLSSSRDCDNTTIVNSLFIFSLTCVYTSNNAYARDEIETNCDGVAEAMSAPEDEESVASPRDSL